MKKFEYDYKIIYNAKTFIKNNLVMLNDMGRDGWELVSTCPANGSAAIISCIFKRELQAEEIKDVRI